MRMNFLFSIHFQALTVALTVALPVQRAMLAAPGKKEKRALRKRCKELDALIGGEHENYRDDWHSVHTDRTDTLLTAFTGEMEDATFTAHTEIDTPSVSALTALSCSHDESILVAVVLNSPVSAKQAGALAGVSLGGYECVEASVKPTLAAVTLDDIEKPEQRLRRLNDELSNVQRAMLAATGKKQKRALRQRCKELDALIGGEHEDYRDDWHSVYGLTSDRTDTLLTAFSGELGSDTESSADEVDGAGLPPSPCTPKYAENAVEQEVAGLVPILVPILVPAEKDDDAMQDTRSGAVFDEEKKEEESMVMAAIEEEESQEEEESMVVQVGMASGFSPVKARELPGTRLGGYACIDATGVEEEESMTAHIEAEDQEENIQLAVEEEDSVVNGATAVEEVPKVPSVDPATSPIMQLAGAEHHLLELVLALEHTADMAEASGDLSPTTPSPITQHVSTLGNSKELAVGDSEEESKIVDRLLEFALSEAIVKACLNAEETVMVEAIGVDECTAHDHKAQLASLELHAEIAEKEAAMSAAEALKHQLQQEKEIIEQLDNTNESLREELHTQIAESEVAATLTEAREEELQQERDAALQREKYLITSKGEIEVAQCTRQLLMRISFLLSSDFQAQYLSSCLTVSLTMLLTVPLTMPLTVFLIMPHCTSHYGSHCAFHCISRCISYYGFHCTSYYASLMMHRSLRSLTMPPTMLSHYASYYASLTMHLLLCFLMMHLSPCLSLCPLLFSNPRYRPSFRARPRSSMGT